MCMAEEMRAEMRVEYDHTDGHDHHHSESKPDRPNTIRGLKD